MQKPFQPLRDNVIGQVHVSNSEILTAGEDDSSEYVDLHCRDESWGFRYDAGVKVRSVKSAKTTTLATTVANGRALYIACRRPKRVHKALPKKGMEKGTFSKRKW